MSLKTPELRSSLLSFATAALQCETSDFSELELTRFRLHGGRAFAVSDDAAQKQHDFVQKAVAKLGPVLGHPKVIITALWDFVTSLDHQSDLQDPKVVSDALDGIAARSSSVCEFFRPCPLIVLPESASRLQIGPVAIERTESRIEEFRKLDERFKFGVGQDWSLSILLAGEEVGIVATLPPTLWSINLAAADPVREEQGLWLTDVALSLIRMSVDFKELGPRVPGVGDVEAHPYRPHDRHDHSFTLKQGGPAMIGGISAPYDYHLTADALLQLGEPSARSKIELAFDAKSKSLAERFHQGCGWLTRARRSKDRSDRLLYFFTALEALLSNSDRSAPVVQTIARHIAVLLTNENSKRIEIANEVKRLYGVRSALVHAGARSALDIDVNTTQQIVEAAYYRVWDDFDLQLAHSEFSALLGRASYGLPLNMPN